MSSPLLVDILAYWNLNDNGSGGVSLVDATGNGNDLTAQGTGATLGAGIIGGCAVFDGVGYLQATSTFNATYPLTYSCWIKSSSVGETGVWGGNGTGYPNQFRIIAINSTIYFQAPSATTANTTGGSYNDGNWHYVVGVADGTNIYLYVDGSLVAQTADNSNGGSAIPYLIGNNGDSITAPSSIDEVGVWSRALSSTEVYDLYYGGLGNTYPFTNPLPVPLTVGCKSYWNLNNDGSGGVSLLDATGNGYTLANNNGVTLGTGIIGGDAVFVSSNSQSLSNITQFTAQTSFTASAWFKMSSVGSGTRRDIFDSISDIGFGCSISTSDTILFSYGVNGSPIDNDSGFQIIDTNWHYLTYTFDGGTYDLKGYIDGVLVDSINTGNPASPWADGAPTCIGQAGVSVFFFDGQIDEVGIWNRALSQSEVTELYNSGAGLSYPFYSPETQLLYYNNAQADGDWGNILNWWQDSGFTIQATALPTATNPVNLYGPVTQNTQGADQCFCYDATFWSADFGVGLTLQSTGVVNMQGSSVMAGATTDGVSMHDSSTLADTSSVAGDVTMRDSSRAYGYIGGNAYVYYDQGNGQFPIGGTVAGSVSYLGWPAATTQWFNDQVSGGADDGDFSNTSNWWTDNTFTTRPINAEGTQQLPDASTDVFIAPTIGITTNSGTANPTINSVTANNSNIQNISITATNGFLFSGNQGVENAVLYGNVVFQDTAYNDHSVIQGKATYKSAASLQNSWYQNSLGNVNAGMYNGSTSFEVNIPTGNSNKGFLSTLLGFPCYIRF